MIVPKPKAEKLLRKRLKGKKSNYYVLSEDGRKNLGGPYSLANAKRRLAQVEYFKQVRPNPAIPPGTRVSFAPTAFEMYYFKAKGLEPGDQGTVMARNPGIPEEDEFDTVVQWDKGLVCKVSSKALRLCNPADWEGLRRLRAAIQARRAPQLPMIRPKYEKTTTVRIPPGFESSWPAPPEPSGETALSIRGKHGPLIVGQYNVQGAVADCPEEVQRRIKDVIRKLDERPEVKRFKAWLDKEIVENPPKDPGIARRIAENVIVSGLTTVGLRGLGILRNPGEQSLNDENVTRALVEHHIKDIEEGASKGLSEYARLSYEDLVGLFERMTPRIYNKFSSEYIHRLRGLRDLVIGSRA